MSHNLKYKLNCVYAHQTFKIIELFEFNYYSVKSSL